MARLERRLASLAKVGGRHEASSRLGRVGRAVRHWRSPDCHEVVVVMKPTPNPDVVIVRSGYATEAQWVKAIYDATRHGRTVLAILETGQEWRPTKDEATAKWAEHAG